MNLSEECVGHRMDEKLLWGQGARTLPPAWPLSAAVQTFPGAEPVPAALRCRPCFCRQRAGQWQRPSLSPLQRNREGADVGLGLCAEQPDPRHPVQLGNAFI